MSVIIKRLEKLPEVFGLQDLTGRGSLGDLAMSVDTAKKFLLRAREKDLVARASDEEGRSPFYYNLHRDPDALINRPIEVASMMYPEATVIGLSVLHAYGWITQIPRTIDVAIDASRRSSCKIRGVNLYLRNPAWFKLQFDNNAILRDGESEFIIDSITPRAALDDILDKRDMWVPASDDLFIPSDEEEGVQRNSPRRQGQRCG